MTTYIRTNVPNYDAGAFYTPRQLRAAHDAGYAASVRQDNPRCPYDDRRIDEREAHGAWWNGVWQHRADAGTTEAFNQ